MFVWHFVTLRFHFNTHMNMRGEEWRGQQWRPGSERWGNRGGKCRDWYSGFYAAKRQGGAHLEAWLQANPKPK